MLIVIVSLLVAYAIWSIIRLYATAAKLPRGPTPLPFVGNLGTTITPPVIYKNLEVLRKKYGPVFTFHMPFPVVNIADYDIMKRAMRTDDFSGRMHTPATDMINYVYNGGIITANGDDWREQRRTTIAILRDFGMGKNRMEQMVLLSAQEYLRYLKDKADLKSIDLRWPIQLFIANIINELVFGFRYKYDDCAPLIDYVEGVVRMFELAAQSKLFMMYMRFPWLRYVPIIGHQAYYIHKNNFDSLKTYIYRETAKAKETYNENDEPTCFVHAYLKKMPTNSALNEEQLYNCCHDLFLAGQETTSTTLRWATLFMAAHQDVQDKVREEIFSVIGKDVEPKLTDKNKMPYTTATIHELQRRANIIAVAPNIFRCTTVDTEIDGMKIPAYTPVNNDLHQVHMTDPAFVDPEKFWPGRYLEKDGVTLKKDLVERTIPFGIGKRLCAGEGLARVELFLGLVVTLQHYKILPPIGGSVDLSPLTYNVHLPRQHNLHLVPV